MTYTCAHCKGVFEEGWSEEEAQVDGWRYGLEFNDEKNS